MVYTNANGQTQCQRCNAILEGPMGIHDFINDCPQCRGPITGIGNLVFTDRIPQLKQESKIGRNSGCPCRSGKKYKKCCYLSKY